MSDSFGNRIAKYRKLCVCGHPAQVHHGVDPVDGCMIVGLPTTPGWCECRLTASQVMERA